MYTIFHSDVDECESDASLCDQICVNTDGSFICECMDGYELTVDNICQGKCFD